MSWGVGVSVAVWHQPVMETGSGQMQFVSIIAPMFMSILQPAAPKETYFDQNLFLFGVSYCVLFLCFTRCGVDSLMKMPFSPDLPYEATFWGNWLICIYQPLPFILFSKKNELPLLSSLALFYSAMLSCFVTYLFLGFSYILLMFCIFHIFLYLQFSESGVKDLGMWRLISPNSDSRSKANQLSKLLSKWASIKRILWFVCFCLVVRLVCFFLCSLESVHLSAPLTAQM